MKEEIQSLTEQILLICNQLDFDKFLDPNKKQSLINSLVKLCYNRDILRNHKENQDDKLEPST